MKFKLLLYAFIFVVIDSKMQVRAANCSNIERENIVYTDGVIEIVPNVMMEECDDDEEEMNEDGRGESVEADLGGNYGVTTSPQHPRVKRDQNSGEDSGERHVHYNARYRRYSGRRLRKFRRIGPILSEFARTPLKRPSNVGSKRNQRPKSSPQTYRETSYGRDGEYRIDENNGRNGYDNDRNNYNDRNGNYDRNGYNNDRSHRNNDRSHQNDRSHENNDRSHQNNENSHQNNDNSHQNNDRSYQNNDRSHRNNDRSHQNDRSNENNDRSHRNNDRSHENNDRSHQNNDRSYQNNGRSHHSDDRNDYERNHNDDRNDRDGGQPRLDQPKGEDSPFRQRPGILSGKRHVLHLKGGIYV